MTTRTLRLHPQLPRRLLVLLGLLLLLCSGAAWPVTAFPAPPPVSAPPVSATPVNAPALIPGVVAAMTAPAFAYSPGWTVNDRGADPAEPADPWTTPAGVITFSYTGRDLLLRLAPGDYWGYLYVTVDDAPANRLPRLPGNLDAQGRPAGYRTLYAPTRQTADGPTPLWQLVHRAPDNGPHRVRVEVWRSWGQAPLRGVAVDAQTPAPWPRWPVAAAGLLGLALVGSALLPPLLRRAAKSAPRRRLAALLDALTSPLASPRPRQIVAGLSVALVAAALLTRGWWFGPLGLGLLAYAALRQPTLWAAALLLGLPFYFSQTLPILPGRATNLIDVGVWGGLAVVIGHWLRTPDARPALPAFPPLQWTTALAAWALVSAAAALDLDVALREVRTVFVAAALFALLLAVCRRDPAAPRWLLGGWLAGSTLIALIGLGQFLVYPLAADTAATNLIQAEGVLRVRSVYGSPNNLALYLERSLMLLLAGVLLAPTPRQRWGLAALAALQGAALLLTFSKGALLLGLPAGLLTLAVGGYGVLRRHGRDTRPLTWLAATALLMGLALLPFVGTERFQRLLDLESGTGFIRLQLWRSSLQMALDHPLLGVGPDNFLATYRSLYLLPAAWQEPDLNHPHTWLLDWWTRLGVPGMLLGLGWWLGGARTLWRRLHADGHTSDDGHAAITLGLLAALAAALGHGLIDLSYAVPDLMLIWALLTSLAAWPPPPQEDTSPQA